MNEVKLRYTEPLLRDAVRFFFLRTLYHRLGPSFFIAMAVSGLGLAWMLFQGEPGWGVGFLLGVCFLMVFFLAAIYVGHGRNTIGTFRRMKSPEAILRYSEDEIGFSSDLGTSSVPWSAIREVWRHDRFWLLVFTPAQFVTLPLDDLDASAQAFILRKVEGRNELQKAPRA